MSGTPETSSHAVEQRLDAAAEQIGASGGGGGSGGMDRVMLAVMFQTFQPGMSATYGFGGAPANTVIDIPPPQGDVPVNENSFYAAFLWNDTFAAVNDLAAVAARDITDHATIVGENQIEFDIDTDTGDDNAVVVFWFEGNVDFSNPNYWNEI